MKLARKEFLAISGTAAVGMPMLALGSPTELSKGDAINGKFVMDTFRKQYSEVFGQLRDAIDTIPDDEWYKADVDHLVPARLAFHALELYDWAMHFPAQKPGVNSIGVKWSVQPPEKLPDRKKMKAYSREMEAKLGKWMDHYQDDLSAVHDKETGVYPFSVLHLLIYTIRHLQLVSGQMSAEIRRRGLEWKHWCW